MLSTPYKYEQKKIGLLDNENIDFHVQYTQKNLNFKKKKRYQQVFFFVSNFNDVNRKTCFFY